MKRNKAAKRIKLPTYHEVDAAVQVWFTQATSVTNLVVGDNKIKAQPLKYASMLNKSGFTASNGWLNNFRARKNISYKTIVGEACLVDNKVTHEYLNDVLFNLIGNCKPFDTLHKDILRLFGGEANRYVGTVRHHDRAWFERV